MTEFEKSRWAEEGFARQYLEEADIYIPERRKLLGVLGSFYRHFCSGKPGNKVLDIGCGDGILTYTLLQIDGTLSATLVDGSEEMLARAKARLRGFKNVQFLRTGFQELVRTDGADADADLIVSSLAIHHLPMDEKRKLFRYLHARLKDGGHFVNVDVVLSPSDALEGWYLTLWREHILKAREASGSKDGHEEIIERYKDNKDNRPDPLAAQMEALRSTGFRDVDCFCKYGIFTMFGGRK